MGLFNWEPVFCDICGKNTRKSICLPRKTAVKDGVVCGDCWWQWRLDNLRLNPSDTTIQQIQGIIDGYKKEEEERKSAYESLDFDVKFDHFEIDTNQKKWDRQVAFYLANGDPFPLPSYTIFSFDDVEEIWSTSGVISYSKSTGKKQNAMGRALAGGVLAGSTGAVVGAVTAKEKSNTSVITQEKHYLYMRLKQYPGKVLRCEVQSPRNADRVIDILTESISLPPAPDPAEELRKYKALLDEGVITAEDYEAKKKQLLGL